MKRWMALLLVMLLTTCCALAEAADEGAGDSNMLIVYFSVLENSAVDAVSSASRTEVDDQWVGTISVLANQIREYTGGDVFSIDTAVAYPADTIIDFAAGEQERGDRPELLNHIEDLDAYDTVFVGYPIWWYDLPQVMYSFFDEYDLSGKTIVPFCTHNGSRFSGTIQTIQSLEPDAVVVTEGFTTNERDVLDAAEDVRDWLSRLGY